MLERGGVRYLPNAKLSLMDVIVLLRDSLHKVAQEQKKLAEQTNLETVERQKMEVRVESRLQKMENFITIQKFESRTPTPQIDSERADSGSEPDPLN